MKKHTSFISAVIFGVVLSSVVLLVSGCDQTKQQSDNLEAGALSAEQQEVLVRIDGLPLTRFDLEQSSLKMLGVQQTSLLDENGRKKLLQSLILSRAMANLVTKSLGKDDLTLIEWQTKNYREQLLTNRYLREYVEPKPVTEQMIKKYYDENSESFDGRIVREYELISSRNQLKGENREQVLQVLSEARLKKDWRKYTNKIFVEKNIPLEFRHGKSGAGLLHAQTHNMLKTLDSGEISKPFFIDGNAYILRVISEQKLAARPIDEVSAEIRKALVPIQLKNAIRKISVEVLGKVNIEYVNR